MRDQYSGWSGPWLKYNGVEVPLKIDGIRDSPEGYIEIDVRKKLIVVDGVFRNSTIVPTLNVVEDKNTGTVTGNATINGVNLDDYVKSIQQEFNIGD